MSQKLIYISAFIFFSYVFRTFFSSFRTVLFLLDECTNQVVAPVVATTSRTSSTTYCTPMRGRMTAHLPSAISTTELLDKEMELLSYIESDISAYTNEDIIKVIYIGSRPTVGTSTSDSVNSVGGVIVGNADVATSESISSSSSSSSSSSKSGISLLTGGIALFIVSIALIIMLVVYKRRRCRNSRNYQFENDINGEGGGGRDVQSRDPDDIQLLPNPDKLDLRSVHSKDSILSNADTENYSHVDDEGEEVDYIDRAIDYMDDVITKVGGSNTNIRSSELAALGMTSTLVTARSYMSPKSYDEEAYYEYENDVEEVEAENDVDDGLVDTDNDDDDGNGNDSGVEVEDIVDEEEETSLPHLGTVIELDNFSTMSSKEESMSSREE